MANTIQDRLYEIFVAIAAKHGRIEDAILDAGDKPQFSVPEALTGHRSVTDSTVKGEELKTSAVVQSQAESLIGPLQSVFTASTAGLSGSVAEAVKQTVTGGGTQSSGGGVLSTVESVASTVFKNAFGMMPLISGLIGLFGGGGDSAAPPPLVKYAMPASIHFEEAENGGGTWSADYDQMGMPRAYGPSENMAQPIGVGSQELPGPQQETTKARSPGPQITVNVQAMDARSFLDRSNDIAAAVRDAMLNLNSINDVVNDL